MDKEYEIYLQAYKNREAEEEYLLFEEDIPNELKIMKLLTMLHSDAIGINKAYELAKECGLFENTPLEIKFNMMDFIKSHPKHEVTDEMILAVKEKSKYDVKNDFNKEIISFLENRACNIDIATKALDNFLDEISGTKLK